MKRFTFATAAKDIVDNDGSKDIYVQYGNEFVHMTCYSEETFAIIMRRFIPTHNVFKVEELTILVEGR